LDQKDIPDTFISVRKDLLDDSNAAKDVMDKVKKKLKLLLRAGHEAPSQFAWPPNTPEPFLVVRQVVELMQFHRKVMRHNFNKLYSATSSLSALSSTQDDSSSTSTNSKPSAEAEQVSRIQSRWCTGEDAELFKERWEKLFLEFADAEKVDPSKISELYDTMKYDALHNRQFLEWVFTPSSHTLEEVMASDDGASQERQPSKRPSVDQVQSDTVLEESTKISIEKPERKGANPISNSTGERVRPSDTIAQRMGFRRRSVLNPLPSPTSIPQDNDADSYFKLFNGNGQTRAKQDKRLHKLRELYRLAKILFDFICPQEYGISDAEKLEIGLLTSLPLLQEIVTDLEEVQASETAKSFIYFTKESHIYTLLNAILGGGIKTKIARNAIPELDYLSQIVFELYEAEDKERDSFAYSIRITITPGCHTADPLDVQLDSKHSIGCAPRRSLTAHQDWMEVIETLRAKFHTVSLPKSFLAVNLSEWHAREMRLQGGGGGSINGAGKDDDDKDEGKISNGTEVEKEDKERVRTKAGNKVDENVSKLEDGTGEKDT
jgi:inositol-hexakisphosphate/diphosphoinositol-pentakisphosphate 1-kinase